MYQILRVNKDEEIDIEQKNPRQPVVNSLFTRASEKDWNAWCKRRNKTVKSMNYYQKITMMMIIYNMVVNFWIYIDFNKREIFNKFFNEYEAKTGDLL